MEAPLMAFDATYIAQMNDTDDTAGWPRWEDPADGERTTEYLPRRKANRERRAQAHTARASQERPRDQRPDRARRGPTRATRQGTEEFKCRHCRAFIGPTIGGGRHRN